MKTTMDDIPLLQTRRTDHSLHWSDFGTRLSWTRPSLSGQTLAGLSRASPFLSIRTEGLPGPPLTRRDSPEYSRRHPPLLSPPVPSLPRPYPVPILPPDVDVGRDEGDGWSSVYTGAGGGSDLSPRGIKRHRDPSSPGRPCRTARPPVSPRHET